MERKSKDTYLNMMKNRGSDREQFKTSRKVVMGGGFDVPASVPKKSIPTM